jgi:hypothetical protein
VKDDRRPLSDADFDGAALRRLQRNADVITCDDLIGAVGYLRPYAAAEKALEREGWFYSVGDDAWHRRAGFV